MKLLNFLMDAVLTLYELLMSFWSSRKRPPSLQSRRILGRDAWIFFRNDVVPPSWTLILRESWDKSKSVFKGEVDGFSLFRCFSRWRPQSMYLQVFVKKRLLCRLTTTLYCFIMRDGHLRLLPLYLIYSIQLHR